ncbi:hypothetical protein NQ314_007985 [Rhamnusium bicolor]|uniref:Integrase catalytic domain-containing protein n=1 Tax=Rhamnusium bicolor TaxID=1586634 RepID=A0AAV8YFV7_9CUCU|nr:hypothetical protein NQ314_007985 [Rhamnusium bicolor]
MLNGEIVSNVSEQNLNGCHLVVPSSRIELHNGIGILTVLNLSKLETSFDKNQCVSRGIPSGQSPTEVLVAPEVLPNDVQQRLDNLLEHLGLFCRTNNDNVYMLVIVDAFTKYLWIEAVPDTTAKHIVQCLKMIIKIFGVPVRIISDRGKCFTSKEMKEFCSEQNIKHILNTIACPRSNGQVERFNATILSAMRAAICDEHNSWKAKITEVQHSINGTVNATTGCAPAELLYGFRSRLKFDVSVDDNEQVDRDVKLKSKRVKAAENIIKSARAMKKRYDRSRDPAVIFKVGDMVMIERKPMVKGLASGKLVEKYIGPVMVQQVLPKDRYRVGSLSKDKRRFKGSSF